MIYLDYTLKEDIWTQLDTLLITANTQNYQGAGDIILSRSSTGRHTDNNRIKKGEKCVIKKSP